MTVGAERRAFEADHRPTSGGPLEDGFANRRRVRSPPLKLGETHQNFGQAAKYPIVSSARHVFFYRLLQLAERLSDVLAEHRDQIARRLRVPRRAGIQKRRADPPVINSIAKKVFGQHLFRNGTDFSLSAHNSCRGQAKVYPTIPEWDRLQSVRHDSYHGQTEVCPTEI